MKKEPVTNLVFNEVVSRLKNIQAGDKYWCSPKVYDYKKTVEQSECPAIILYQADDAWNTGSQASPANEAMGNVKINIDQQIIIAVFHESVEKLNRLKADIEIALLNGTGNLLLRTDSNPPVTYKLGGPTMALPPDDLALGNARFILTAFYQRQHGDP